MARVSGLDVSRLLGPRSGLTLSRRFAVLGELRYAMASDTRILSYTIGF